MTEPIWVRSDVVIAVHEEQIAEHGGAPGLRDQSLLESALARPQNRHAYEPDADLADLAASYAHGLAKNHPFIDGNKRTGYVVAELFLDLNGLELIAEDMDCILRMLSLAAGETSEEEFAAWLRGNIRPRSP